MVITYANYLSREGHKVSIFTNEMDTVFKLDDQVKIENIHYKGRVGTVLYGLKRPLDADLIIADIILLTVILSFRNHGRVLYFAQDYDIFYYQHWLLRKCIDGLYFWGLKHRKIPTIAVSKELKEELKRFGNDIVVIQNGIDQKIFSAQPNEKYLLMKEHRKAILILGRRDYRKGLDVALKVLESLKGLDFEVWVVGGHVECQHLENKIRNFGFVPQEELVKIISSADLVFHPTRHEGFGLFVLEAAACGTPVVTTQAVSLVKNLKGVWRGEVDQVEDFQKGISSLLNEEGLRAQMIKESQKLAEIFNIRRSCQRFEQQLLIRYKA